MGAVKAMLDNWIAALEEDTNEKEPIINEVYRFTYMGSEESFAALEANIADGSYIPQFGDIWRIRTSGGKDAAGTSIKARDLVIFMPHIIGIGNRSSLGPLGWYIYMEEEDTQMNEKKIVFISQTMRGLSDEDILAAREEAIQDIYNILAEKGIEKECIEIADSYFDDYNATILLENVTNIPLMYLG